MLLQYGARTQYIQHKLYVQKALVLDAPVPLSQMLLWQALFHIHTGMAHPDASSLTGPSETCICWKALATWLSAVTTVWRLTSSSACSATARKDVPSDNESLTHTEDIVYCAARSEQKILAMVHSPGPSLDERVTDHNIFTAAQMDVLFMAWHSSRTYHYLVSFRTREEAQWMTTRSPRYAVQRCVPGCRRRGSLSGKIKQ